VLSLHPLPAGPAGARTVRLCRTRLGINPDLAGLKTLNRLESVMARAEWRDERIWDGLMRDVEGSIVCGTMSNVFLRRGSTLMTPALDRCGVAGIMRRWVLEQAADLHLAVWQGRLPIEAFRDAEEVFMTNAVQGIVPVRLIQAGGDPLRLPSIETAERLRTRLERA